MTRQVVSNSADLSLYLLQLQSGGIAASNAPVGLDNIGGISRSKLNAASGVCPLDSGVKIPVANIPSPIITTWVPTIQGVNTTPTNIPVALEITNLDSLTTVTLTATEGSVSRSGSTITYTPPSVVSATSGFTVNGYFYSVTTTLAIPTKPYVTSPVNNTTNANKVLNATSSAFASVTGGETHTSSDWQLSLSSAFTSSVASSIGSTTNKTSWTVTGLSVSTIYYLRVRHTGSSGRSSQWSDGVIFATRDVFQPDTEEAKLIASDKLAADNFGTSIDINSDGTRIIVGVPNSDPGGTSAAGAAYIYLRTGTTWTQEAKLVASDKIANGLLGTSVSISSDGSRAVCGAPGTTSGLWSKGGCGYIFLRTGTTWAQEAKALSSDAAINDNLGRSISISDAGTRLIIGSDLIDPSLLTSAGAAYVFSRSGTTWTQEAKLIASDKVSNDFFGFDVAISGDETRVIIGAPGCDPSSLSTAGAAYIFSRSGTTWAQELKLIALDKTTNAQFGSAVDICTDGSRAVVGAFNAAVTGTTAAGCAYVWSRSGTAWTQEYILTASDKAASDNFGWSVSISSDALRVVVGTYLADVSSVVDAGAAYIFFRSGISWTQAFKLSASDKITTEKFGTSCSISADGTRIAVGAGSDSPGSISTAGSAYVYS